MIPHFNFEVYVSLFCKSKTVPLLKCENNLQVKNTTVAILIKNAWLEMVFITKQRFNSL